MNKLCYHTGQLAMQERGSLATSDPDSGLLAFPSTLEHSLKQCELVDKARSGWRRLLALYLVDPNHDVFLTKNVLPLATTGGNMIL